MTRGAERLQGAERLRERRAATDHASARLGGALALLGGLGAIVVNVFHPRTPAETEALLELVATTPHWTILHFAAAVASVLAVAGIALLVRTLHAPGARALGEAGKYVTVLGAGTFLVAIMVDGVGYPAFTQAWLAGRGNEATIALAAASALHAVDLALFPVWSGLYLGLGVLLVAAALGRGGTTPPVVAAIGILGAAMSLAYAASGVADVRLPLPLWPWGPALVALWMTLVGAIVLFTSARTHA